MTQKEAVRMKGALWSAKQSKTTKQQNSWADDGQCKSPKMKHSDQKGALRKPLWKEQSLQNAKKNNKTTKKNSSDRRRPSKKL